MKDCEMCGRSAGTHGHYRWFIYDNGEMTRMFCCVGCLFQHDLLTDNGTREHIPTIVKESR